MTPRDEKDKPLDSKAQEVRKNQALTELTNIQNEYVYLSLIHI